MRARELMSSPVVTVQPESTLKEVAARMAAHRVSGLPVVDERGILLGILSESDVLTRLEPSAADLGPRSVLSHLLGARYSDPKLHARTAGELMNTRVVTAGPDASFRELLHLMVAHNVNRVPIIESHRVVGIVTRADLLRAVARPDRSITVDAQWRILHDLWIDTCGLNITTRDGVLTIAGEIGTRGEAELLARWMKTVEGVVDVDTRNLHYRVDDRNVPSSKGPSEPATGGWEAVTPAEKETPTD